MRLDLRHVLSGGGSSQRRGVVLLRKVVATAELAAALGVSEGDVDVLLGQLGERTARLPTELASFLRGVVDPPGERTARRG